MRDHDRTTHEPLDWILRAINPFWWFIQHERQLGRYWLL